MAFAAYSVLNMTYFGGHKRHVTPFDALRYNIYSLLFFIFVVVFIGLERLSF